MIHYNLLWSSAKARDRLLLPRHAAVDYLIGANPALTLVANSSDRSGGWAQGGEPRVAGHRNLVIGPIDHGDPHGRSAEGFRRPQPRKPSPHDHDVGRTAPPIRFHPWQYPS